MNKNKKKWHQDISNWVVLIACVILIPVILINLSIMFQSKTNVDKVPSVFGIKPFMVLSGSMETEIKKGDLIITKVVDPESLGVRDVIAFKDAAGTVTTHRIIDIVNKDNQTYFITKGDNNSIQDKNLVSLKDVEGLYLFRIPGIGSMMKSLSEPMTIIILVLLITLVFAIGFVISNKKLQESEREEYLAYKRRKELEMQLRMRENYSKKSVNKSRQNDIKRDIINRQREDNRNNYINRNINNNVRKDNYKPNNNIHKDSYKDNSEDRRSR